MITLGLVDSVDANGVYVTMPGSRGAVRGPYKSLSTVAAGTTVLMASTDDGEQVVVGPSPGGDGRFNVQSFGAVGDGVTDDTAAIQSALDVAWQASDVQGAAVFFPQGTYRITSALTVRGENVRIVGTGRRKWFADVNANAASMPSTILCDHSGPCLTLSSHYPTGGFQIEDITLIGKAANRESANHIGIDYDLRGDEFHYTSVVQRVSIQLFNTAIGTRATGTGSMQNQIADLRVTDSIIGNNAWVAQCLDETSWNKFTFTNNAAGGNGWGVGEGGLSVRGHNITISDNILEGQRDPVIINHSGHPGRGLVVKNNYFEANIGDACINVGTAATPVDIGPNFYGLVSTAHKVLLGTNVTGTCLDAYFPSGASKIHPPIGSGLKVNSAEGSLANSELAADVFVYCDAPRADHLTSPRGLLAAQWGVMSDVRPTPSFLAGYAKGGGASGNNVGVMLLSLTGTGAVNDTRTISATAGQILVSTSVFRRRSSLLDDLVPYVALKPDAAANESVEASLWVETSFMDDDWIVATIAMLLTHDCTQVTTLLHPYGIDAGASGKEVEWVRPSVYTVTDANSITSWAGAYGTADAAPTNGAWKVGDEVVNYYPSAGGAYKWVCTASGTPGTWKAVNLAS